MAIVPLAFLACLITTDWSVDPAGGGDFTSLAGALAATEVLDGDRLWIAPGEYGQLTTQKSVDLLALPGQRFFTDILTLSQVSGVTIQGLTTRKLELNACPGAIDLMDVEVGRGVALPIDPAAPMISGKLTIIDCQQVLLAGCLLRGTRQCYPEANSPENALSALNSNIAISGSTILGGEDLGVSGRWYCSAHYPTPTAIDATQCELTLSSVIVLGGASAWAMGGRALYMNGGVLDARGSGAETWVSGHSGSEVISGIGQGSWSGISTSPPGLPSWLSIPDAPLPLLRAAPVAVSGSPFKVELFAPLGVPAALAFSAFPAFDSSAFPGQGSAWIDLTAPLAIHLAFGNGSALPASEIFQVTNAPALLGLAIRLQAYVPPCATPACLWSGQGSLTPPLGVLIQ